MELNYLLAVGARGGAKVRAIPRLQAMTRSCIAVFALAGGYGTAAETVTGPPLAAAPADDGQWVMPAKNFASTRYSELNEINTDTVAKLGVAFVFSTGVNKGQEAA